MGIFGQFDGDGNGTIDVNEFQSLWEHLGGPALAPSPAAVQVAPPRSQATTSFASQVDQPSVDLQNLFVYSQVEPSPAYEYGSASAVAAPATVSVPATASVPVPVAVEDLARQEERAAVTIQSRARGRTARRKAKAARGRPVVRPSTTKSRPASAQLQHGAVRSNGGSNSTAALSDVDRQEILQTLHTVRRQQQADDAPPQSLSVVSAQANGHPRAGYPVIVADESSVHCGKVGRLVSETPSKQFAIVQFEGESKTCPVKTDSLRAGSSGRLLTAEQQGQKQQMQKQKQHDAPHHIVAGDSVEVVDPSSAFFGSAGEVVSTTPSGEFLCVRLSGQEKPRPLRADAVQLTGHGYA